MDIYLIVVVAAEIAVVVERGMAGYLVAAYTFLKQVVHVAHIEATYHFISLTSSL